jgi:4-amino-4-deoxy-L-arabinose transferase-like glycosyltransferase
MMLRRKLIFTVLALTVAALLLRLWGVGFGLPYEYHIDEHFYYPHAWSMGQGQLELPDQSHGPSLYLGLLLLGQKSMQVTVFPQLSNVDFGALRDTNPWPYLLSARLISALLGALTIPIVFLLARRYREHVTGLVAAAIMTVLFFHVRDSHFGVPDSLTTLFTALAGWLAVRAYQTRQASDVLWAGLAAGIATGAKYTSAIVFVSILLAVLLQQIAWRRRAQLIALSVLGLIAGFVISYPNILINPAAFIKDISFLSVRVSEGYEGWRIVPDNSALFYLDTLMWSTGLVTLILTGIGLIAAIVRRQAEGLILGAFPVLYFITLSLSHGHFGRYLLPMLPFTVVLLADAGWNVLPALIRRAAQNSPRVMRLAQPIGVLVILAVLIPNLLNSLRFDWLLAQADTRTVAKQWIENNLAAGTRIAIEWPYHTPPLSNGYETPPESTREYWIDRVWGFGLADRPLEQYQSDGTQFIIASSFVRDIPVAAAPDEERRQQFYAQLPQVFQRVQTFSPRCDGGDPTFIFDQLYGPAIDLWTLCWAGPQIDIYQVH